MILRVAYMDTPWTFGENTLDVLRGWMAAPARNS